MAWSTPKIPGKFSLRASPTGSIVLEDCRMPRDNILPKASGLQARSRASIPHGLVSLGGF